MGYSVTYNPELRSQYPAAGRKSKIPNTKLLLYTLLVVIAGYILVKCGVVQFLLPGDIRITAAAFSSMIEQVAGGEPVGEAVVTFIQDVVTNGA